MSKFVPLGGIVVSVLLALASGAHAAGAAHGGGGLEKTTEYYAEEEHKTLVGELIRGCGHPQRWGRTTHYTLEGTAPCNAKARRQDTVAAHVMLHQDPLSACRQRCDRKHHVPTFCAPNDPPEACGDGPRNACLQACDEAYGSEEPSP